MKLLASLSALLLSGLVMATPVHNIVVFGDSLSDNGNLYELMNKQLPQSPPYFEGRFSDGPVWIEQLAASLFPTDFALHLQNYALGGAEISNVVGNKLSLTNQVNNYMDEHQAKAEADSLYVVWIGANNYLGLPDKVEKTLKEVNEGIVQELQRLADTGAKHIMVLNLPDLGRTPAALEYDIAEPLNYFTKQHNTDLEMSVAKLKQSNPEVNWLYFDINSAFNEVLDNPKQYGVTNTLSTCFESVLAYADKKSMLNVAMTINPHKKKDACEGHLFFDLVHPTVLGHRILADKAQTFLEDAGLEFVD